MTGVFFPKPGRGEANASAGQISAKNHVDISIKQAILKEQISDVVPKLVDLIFLLKMEH